VPERIKKTITLALLTYRWGLGGYFKVATSSAHGLWQELCANSQAEQRYHTSAKFLEGLNLVFTYVDKAAG
ncbi:Os05g0277350, partial [Oryza sativa Japonica Group]